MAWCSLESQPGRIRKTTAEMLDGAATAAGGVAEAAKNGNANDASAPPFDTEYGHDDLPNNARMSVNESGNSVGILSDGQDMAREPLLAASSGGSGRT